MNQIRHTWTIIAVLCLMLSLMAGQAAAADRTGAGAKQNAPSIRSGPSERTGHITLKRKLGAMENDFLREFPNNYTLEGSVYRLYRDRACTDGVRDTGGRRVEFTSDKDGASETFEIELGSESEKFYFREEQASKGYLLDSVPDSVELTVNDTAARPRVLTPTVMPTYTKMKVEVEKRSTKYEAERLEGTLYRLSYYDLEPGTDPKGHKPKRTWIAATKTVVSEEDGGALKSVADFMLDPLLDGSDEPYTEMVRIIPLGVISIEEYRPPKGHVRDTELYGGMVSQPSPGEKAAASLYSRSRKGGLGTRHIIDVTPKLVLVNTDEPQVIEIKIRKLDAVTGRAEAQGSGREYCPGTLAGAEYRIYYEDPAGGGEELVGTVITDENGEASLRERTEGRKELIGTELEQGRYYIEETRAPPGYLPDRYYYREVPGVYENGRHIADIRGVDEEVRVFTHVTESMEPARRVSIRKTDASTGGELPGARLCVIDSSGHKVEEWISSEEPHVIWALPEGKYILRELSAPYGYDVADDVVLEVKADEAVTEAEMKNTPVRISTTAADAGTGSHQGIRSGSVTIRDRVMISGLQSGREYLLKGHIIDKASGETLKAAGGGPAEISHSFTASGGRETIELSFSLDPAQIGKDTASVAFERLYRKNRILRDTDGAMTVYEEDPPAEIARHEDAGDEGQTVRFGGIASTEAADRHSGERNTAASGEAEITDIVSFSNLSTEETYKIEGELYDKTAKKRTGIKASTEIRPGLPDGRAAVEFRFDARPYEGHALVVFETLSVGGEVVSRHEDPDDEKQTVYVPGISTSAGRPEGKKVTDTVSYKNLLPGRKYIIKGYFVDKKSGKKIEKSDGVKTFTPEKSEGTTEVVLDLADSEGDVVAYEFCYIQTGSGDMIKNVLVAKHDDIGDAKQTVRRGSPPTGDRDTRELVLCGLSAVISALLLLMIIVSGRKYRAP